VSSIPSPGCGSGARSKGALYRETLQTTGFYVGRVVIVPREFAPIPSPPLHQHGVQQIAAPEMRFPRHGRIYRSDRAGLCAKARRCAAAPCRAPQIRPFSLTFPLPGSSGARFEARSRSSSAMSSGRLFLDRVARQQSPSPLHRQIEHNMHFIDTWDKGDISTLPGGRHFYFALTRGNPQLDISLANRRE
jgi:hypothetical protein